MDDSLTQDISDTSVNTNLDSQIESQPPSTDMQPVNDNGSRKPMSKSKKKNPQDVDFQILEYLKNKQHSNEATDPDMAFLKGLLPYFHSMDMMTKLDVQF